VGVVAAALRHSMLTKGNITAGSGNMIKTHKDLD
jgi:hypothetical protein